MKKLITLLLSFLLVSCTRQELQTRRATYPSKLTIELLTTDSQKPEVKCKLSLEETTRIDKVKVVEKYKPTSEFYGGCLLVNYIPLTVLIAGFIDGPTPGVILFAFLLAWYFNSKYSGELWDRSDSDLWTHISYYDTLKTELIPGPSSVSRYGGLKLYINGRSIGTVREDIFTFNPLRVIEINEEDIRDVSLKIKAAIRGYALQHEGTLVLPREYIAKLVDYRNEKIKPLIKGYRRSMYRGNYTKASKYLEDLKSNSRWLIEEDVKELYLITAKSVRKNRMVQIVKRANLTYNEATRMAKRLKNLEVNKIRSCVSLYSHGLIVGKEALSFYRNLSVYGKLFVVLKAISVGSDELVSSLGIPRFKVVKMVNEIDGIFKPVNIKDLDSISWSLSEVL